jgi:hypothetical protein
MDDVVIQDATDDGDVTPEGGVINVCTGNVGHLIQGRNIGPVIIGGGTD